MATHSIYIQALSVGCSCQVNLTQQVRKPEETFHVGSVSNQLSHLYDGAGISFWRRDNHCADNTIVGVRYANTAMDYWGNCHSFHAFVLDDCSSVARAVRKPFCLATPTNRRA
jgi:hypothetical protein